MRLPEGTYRMAEGAPGLRALGWLLAHYRFDRYLGDAEPVPQRVLLTTEPVSNSVLGGRPLDRLLGRVRPQQAIELELGENLPLVGFKPAIVETRPIAALFAPRKNLEGAGADIGPVLRLGGGWQHDGRKGGDKA